MKTKQLMLGMALGVLLLLIVAFVPSLTDFCTTQFNNANNKVTIGSGALVTNFTAWSLDTNISLYIGTNGFNLGGNGDVNGSGTVTVLDGSRVSQYLQNGTNLETSTDLTPYGYARANVTGDGLVNYLDRKLIEQIALSSMTTSNAHWLGKWIKGRMIQFDLLSHVAFGAGPFARDALAAFEVIADPSTNNAFMVNTNWLCISNGMSGFGTITPKYTVDVAGTGRVSVVIAPTNTAAYGTVANPIVSGGFWTNTTGCRVTLYVNYTLTDSSVSGDPGLCMTNVTTGDFFNATNSFTLAAITANRVSFSLSPNDYFVATNKSSGSASSAINASMAITQ